MKKAEYAVSILLYNDMLTKPAN